MALPYLGFFWSKILPISYDNYLSETEILEAIRRKVDTLIDGVNTLGAEVEDFDQKLSEEVEEQVKSKVENEVAKYMDDFEDRLSNLRNELKRAEAELSKKQDILEKDINDFKAENAVELSVINDTLEAHMRRIDSLAEELSELEKNLGALLQEYIVKFRREIIAVMENNTAYILRTVRKYLSELTADNIMVNNPIYPDKTMSLQEALYFLPEWMYGLTAGEYRALGLTTEEYAKLKLTCFEYRFFRRWEKTKTILERLKGKRDRALYSVLGRSDRQPVDGAFETFGQSVSVEEEALFTYNKAEYDDRMQKYDGVVGFEKNKYFALAQFDNFFNSAVQFLVKWEVPTETFAEDTNSILDTGRNRIIDVQFQAVKYGNNFYQNVASDRLDFRRANVNHNFKIYWPGGATSVDGPGSEMLMTKGTVIIMSTQVEKISVEDMWLHCYLHNTLWSDQHSAPPEKIEVYSLLTVPVIEVVDGEDKNQNLHPSNVTLDTDIIEVSERVGGYNLYPRETLYPEENIYPEDSQGKKEVENYEL